MSTGLPLSPEAALRLHQAGDRSPEVLAALSQAAWEAFHEPWEHPEATMNDEPEAPLGEDGPDRITEARLGAWLDAEGYRAFHRPGMGYLVRFKYSLRTDRCVHFQVQLSGKRDDVLCLRWTCDRRVPPEQFLQALRCCNAWNEDYRFPRAMVDRDYLWVDPDAEDKPAKEDLEAREFSHSGLLCLDHQVPLRGPIADETLATILDATLDASWTFWRRAREEYGL